MPVFVKGDVSIYYEVHGSGFPLLLLPPGGMNASLARWGQAAINPIEIFSREYMVVALDERNAGQSSGPLDMNDPWGMYASDQLGLMNHLGIERFHAMGCCIGCSQVLHLIEKAPERVVSGVLEQPVGTDDNNKSVLPNMWKEWADQLVTKRKDVDMPTAEAFGRKMWEGEFVLSVTREFVKNCHTPLMVLPGIDLHHPTAIGREVAALAPNAQIVEPWKEPSTLVPGAVARVRQFLESNTPS